MLISKPDLDRLLHGGQLGLRGDVRSLKEMVGSRDDNRLSVLRRANQGFQDLWRTELVVASTDEEERPRTALKELVGIVPVGGPHGQPDGESGDDASVSAGGSQSYVCSEREPGNQQRQMVVAVQPIHGGVDILLLARALINVARAETNAAKVEAKDGNTKVRQDLHRVVDNLSMHGAAGRWIGMADESAEGSFWYSGVQQRFQATGRPVEILDLTDMGGSS